MKFLHIDYSEVLKSHRQIQARIIVAEERTGRFPHVDASNILRVLDWQDKRMRELTEGV